MRSTGTTGTNAVDWEDRVNFERIGESDVSLEGEWRRRATEIGKDLEADRKISFGMLLQLLGRIPGVAAVRRERIRHLDENERSDEGRGDCDAGANETAESPARRK